MNMHALLSTKSARISSSVRILPSPSNKHVEDSKSSNTKENSFVPWYGLKETLKSIFSLQETNLRFCHLKLWRVKQLNIKVVRSEQFCHNQSSNYLQTQLHEDEKAKVLSQLYLILMILHSPWSFWLPHSSCSRWHHKITARTLTFPRLKSLRKGGKLPFAVIHYNPWKYVRVALCIICNPIWCID